jgi:hypothetical protein
MNNKILVGSILSVIILILVSFTSVVGYRSVSSDVKASPLFNIRSSRAIDEENKELSCEYVGMGVKSILSIPKRFDNIELVQKFIDNIRTMDDKTFNKFLYQLITQIQKRTDIKNVNINELIIAIHQIRNNPDKFITDKSDYSPYTYNKDWFPTICWFPGCIILIFIYLIFAVIITFIIITIGPETYCYCPSVNMPCLNRNLLR